MRRFVMERSGEMEVFVRVVQEGAFSAAGTLVPILESYNPGDLELIHAVHLGGGHVPRPRPRLHRSHGRCACALARVRIARLSRRVPGGVRRESP